MTTKVKIFNDVVYEFGHKYNFLLNSLDSNFYSSRNGKTLLRYSYLKKNKLFGKPLQLLCSHDLSQVSVIFKKSSYEIRMSLYIVDAGSMTIDDQILNYYVDYSI